MTNSTGQAPIHFHCVMYFDLVCVYKYIVSVLSVGALLYLLFAVTFTVYNPNIV